MRKVIKEFICPRCKGKGFVISIFGTISQLHIEYFKKTCPVCNGHGYILREIEITENYK